MHWKHAQAVGCLHIKIEYHAVGDTWWQPLLFYGRFKVNIGLLSFSEVMVHFIFYHEKLTGPEQRMYDGLISSYSLLWH